jgi:hypothetical protein
MSFQPSARMIARKRDINIGSLIEILSYRRPYPSSGEMEFINVTLDNIEGMMVDEIGNRYLRIDREDGTQSNVLWSCHTDSVHAPIKEGDPIRQNLRWDAAGNIIGLNEGRPGQCLGADDGAGLWLMLEMIEARKHGLYLFHRGEEKGGIGSRWLVKNTPELLDGIDYAIAFDRKDLSSVITHQGGSRCCSDDFGNALGAALSRVKGLTMKLDTGGSFTDTAVYTDHIAECTNVSVGYYNQHGPRETLDVRHMIRMRDALLQLDTDADLVVVRKAGDRESLYQAWGGSYYSNRNFSGQTSGGGQLSQIAKQRLQKANGTPSALSEEDAYEAWLEENYSANPTNPVLAQPRADSVKEALVRMIERFPEVAADLLMGFGLDQWEFADAALADAFHRAEIEPDAPEEEPIECASCLAVFEADAVPLDLRCDVCYASLIDPMEEAIAAQDEAEKKKRPVLSLPAPEKTDA